MTPLVDRIPYPFDLPQGGELLKILDQTYPRSRAVEQIAVQAGYSLSALPLESPAHDILFYMLSTGPAAGRVRKLVEAVLSNEPEHIRADFLQRILVDPPETIPVDAERTTSSGAPQFLRGTAILADQEALLFHDDLMITVESIPRLSALLTRLSEVAGSVCLIRTASPGLEQHGTGFRIGDNLVLTNWHVLHFADSPTTAVEVRFHYDDDGTGQPRPTLPLRGDLATIAGDATDDWVIIRLVDAIPADVPITSLVDIAEPILDEPAYIVQHPGGGTKRLAFIRNKIFYKDDKVVQYLSDTQQGSSGAPVFDKNCRLIAVHRQGGTPQAKAGKPPMKKNEGLRAGIVAAGLSARGIAIS
jgi:hypothetical protein